MLGNGQPRGCVPNAGRGRIALAFSLAMMESLAEPHSFEDHQTCVVRTVGMWPRP
jgi:hypothetical protein